MNSFHFVDVITGTRLHFGLICGTPETGWVFGGIGLMVRQPGWHLRLMSGSADCVQFRQTSFTEPDSTLVQPTVIQEQAVSERIQKLIATLRNEQWITSDAVHVEVRGEIPFHSGFGAGTQLALAVASGLRLLCGHSRDSRVDRLAARLGRAGRSEIGTRGFQSGGFLVDRGQLIRDECSSDSPSDRVLRIRIPEPWRFVLIRPRFSEGLSGTGEADYFERQKRMSFSQVNRLAALIEGDIVPAIERADFPVYARGIQTYGKLVGEFYATEQGGVFSNALMQRVADDLTNEGFPGAAQSSWGPCICVPASDQTVAEVIRLRVLTQFPDDDLDVTLTEAMSSGAIIRTPAVPAAPEYH